MISMSLSITKPRARRRTSSVAMPMVRPTVTRVVVRHLITLWPIVVVAYCGACATSENCADCCLANVPHVVRLSRYLPWRPNTLRSFTRTDTSRPNESPTLYMQRTSNRLRAEGTLIETKPLPISMYLDRDSDRPDRPRLRWKTPPSRNSGGFFVDFLPPFVEWPMQLSLDNPYIQQGTIHLYDSDGQFLSTGPATRSVWLERYETIDQGGSVYPRCMVLGSRTELGLGWWGRIELAETVWLARDIGVVRRVQRIEGDMLILFRFQSEYRFDLWKVVPTKRRNPPATDEPKRWARLAVYLDRLLPNPRVGGLIVEWAGPNEENADRESSGSIAQPRPR